MQHESNQIAMPKICPYSLLLLHHGKLSSYAKLVICKSICTFGMKIQEKQVNDNSWQRTPQSKASTTLEAVKLTLYYTKLGMFVQIHYYHATIIFVQ